MAEQEQIQLDLLIEYYLDNPNRDIPHKEVVAWAREEWLKRTGRVFEDVQRGVRSLYDKGFLKKVKKGVYRYDPDLVEVRELEDFTAQQKQIILERDGYKCVVCGRGTADGVELQVDHKKPKSAGGQATVENGQTLCAQHNFRKKNYSQIEFSKKIFIDLLKSAKKSGDADMIAFCEDILLTYEKHAIDGHIEWND